MAARPRRELIDESRVGTYHCFVQAVRQAFLIGKSFEDGKDYTHRQAWVRDRVEALGSVFSIDVVDYAAMSNHMHLILRNRPDVLATWSDEEVVRRWLLLNRHTLRLRRPPTESKVKETLKNKRRVAKLRKRLSNISWFMAYLNQPIANAANEEDEKTGHFWADRFGSVELEDEEARLACILYVDLNRVRAGEARAPEEAKNTAIHDRVRDWIERNADHPNAGWLAPLSIKGDGYLGAAARRRASDLGVLRMTEEEYLEYLDTCGRAKVPGKRGWIPSELPPILERLQMSASRWEDAVRTMTARFDRIQRKADEQADRRSPNRRADEPDGEVSPPAGGN